MAVALWAAPSRFCEPYSRLLVSRRCGLCSYPPMLVPSHMPAASYSNMAALRPPPTFQARTHS
eukprot:scaffold250367_cov31-Tisochrysis_lutea.AAC.5